MTSDIDVLVDHQVADVDAAVTLFNLCSQNSSVFKAVIAAGFRTPAELRTYLDRGIPPDIAAEFWLCNVDAARYIPWEAASFSPYGALCWIVAGATGPDEAFAWMQVSMGDALDLRRSGFDIDNLPPVRQDRENSNFAGPMTVVRDAGLASCSPELYRKLIGVYACPLVTFRAVRQDRALADVLLDIPDGLLRSVLVVVEQDHHTPLGGDSASIIRQLLGQLREQHPSGEQLDERHHLGDVHLGVA